MPSYTRAGLEKHTVEHPLNTLCTDIKCTACAGKTFDSQKLRGLAFVIPGR